MKDGILHLNRGYKFCHRFYVPSMIYHYKILKTDDKTKNDFLYEHFKEALIAARSHYGNIPFIVLNYSNNELRLPSGIDVINLKDLSDKNFLSEEYTLKSNLHPNDDHPNAKAWEEITPLLIKILKRKKYIN